MLLNVQIVTLLYPLTVQKYIDPPVSKVHAGSFSVSVIHRTLHGLQDVSRAYVLMRARSLTSLNTDQ